jgi:addiction module HigA family antidote
MTQKELSARTGLTPKTVNEIVQGKAPITPETALKLERVFGRPAHFWNGLERQYQETQARLAERELLKNAQKWLSHIPTNEMIRLGWISKQVSFVEQLEEVLRFFGVASPQQWRTVWETHQVAYRQSKRFETQEEAVSAWLRKGEIEGQEIETLPYDRERFIEALRKARALTLEAPQVFQEKLPRLCADAGVAAVFVPELPKTGLWGATRWITPEKALIQLSLRYKTNDHLWFTFFHEAAHLLLHGKKDIFLEGKGMDDTKEAEANRFAADFLIPPHELKSFLGNGLLTLGSIQQFADHIGIAAGIVVGRLQHDGIIGQHVGNGLKRRYRWA